MSFIWPIMLLLLLFLPLFIGLYLRLQQRRKKLTASYANLLGGTPGSPTRALGFRRHIPAILFLFGLAVLITALARPKMEMRLPRIEGTVMLLFDVSGSMSADDSKPTRLEAAKAAARDFIQRQPAGVRIGVVAFSDNGFSIQKPSANQEEIFAAVDRLSVQRGTSLGQGILASINAIAADRDLEGQAVNLDNLATPEPGDRFNSASIVLFSDGENNEDPDPLAAAKAAMQHGVKIYTVGVGTANGATLHIDGFNIHSMLNEDMLKQIAQISDGSYFYAGEETTIQDINTTMAPQIIFKAEEMEITAVLAGASILLLLVGGAFSLVWLGRLP
jgi:Ca-activated chloride channel homolog